MQREKDYNERMQCEEYQDEMLRTYVENPLLHSMRELVKRSKSEGKNLTPESLRKLFSFLDEPIRVEENLKVLYWEGLIDSSFIKPEQLSLNLDEKPNPDTTRCKVINLFNGRKTA